MNPTTSQRHNLSIAFLLLVVAFVTALIVSNIISVKLFEVRGWVLPAGTIIFPISYIIGDVLTEVYGYRRARQVIWLGFAANLVVVLVIVAAIALPPASFWDGQDAYERILGFAPRLLLASFAAYLVGEFANAYIMARMKILTRGRWLWTRTIGSTLVGQGLDSMVFMTIAFAGVMPIEVLLGAVVLQWLVKSTYEALATPLTYWVVGALKRHEGIDTYDYDVDFNPLKVSE